MATQDCASQTSFMRETEICRLLWFCMIGALPAEEAAAEALSTRIVELCIEKGGSITGEHGVGEEKKYMMAKM